MIADSRPDRPLWVPDPARSAATRMAAFTAHARTVSGQALASYAELHAWSVGQPEPFWTAIWDFCGVVGERGAGPALPSVVTEPARFVAEATFRGSAGSALELAPQPTRRSSQA